MASKAKRPHILILMPDTHRGDCLGSAGHPHVKTPHLDALAAEGVRFTNCYSPCPICMPARSSFLTGLHPHGHNQWNNYGRCRPDVDNYLRHVKRAGYHTCQLGKSHLDKTHDTGWKTGRHMDEIKPFLQELGFDDVLETTGPQATVGTESIVTDHWKKVGCLETYREDYRKRWSLPPEEEPATWPSPMPEGEHLDDFVGKTAVKYIEDYDKEEPLLLFVGFGGPHGPWDPPKSWADKYDADKMDLPLPPTAPGEWVPEEAAAHQRKMQDPSKVKSEEKYRAVRALYYAKIAHEDWWYGKIFDTLKEKKMWDDTAVVFWSDHGDMLGDKTRWSKSVFYQGSVDVPMIIRTPDCKEAGKTSDALVGLTDGMPTILELAGCEPSKTALGRSLVPCLDDAKKPVHDAVFSEIKDRTMIFDGRYKMVVDKQNTVLKLYDMKDDPDEAVNLVGKKEHEETIGRLKERMLKWYLETQIRW